MNQSEGDSMNTKDPEYKTTMQKKQNMDLWLSLAPSDMKYLKKVAFGSRKFTSIDPQYQIMKMTEKLPNCTHTRPSVCALRI